MTFNIDNDFKNLIPPLSNEEFKQLEENILRDGIQDPLKVWNGTLIDGHNRYTIAQKHGLHFEVTEMDFPDKDAVKQWIVFNQFGRRNISTYNKVCLALKLKPIFSADSQKRMLKGKSDPKPILAQGTTNEQIAKLAGVGKETVRKVEKIQELAFQINLEDVVHELEKGAISISFAYEVAICRKQKMEERVANIAEHIQNFNESLSMFQKLYDDFCSLYEKLTPTEQVSYKETKQEFEKARRVFESFAI